MIRKRPRFARGFRWLVTRQMRRDLDGIWIRGLASLTAALDRGPLLIASTHVAYWDPLVLMALEQRVGGDGYALMAQANLDRMPFFGWTGAIGVDPARPRSALQAAATLLDRPGRTVAVFPQGRQRPSHLRPLGLQPGVHLVARLADAPVVPLALTYGFREADRPAAFVDVGPILRAGPDRGAFVSALEGSLIAGLDRIDDHLDAGQGDFEPVIAASRPPLAVGTRLLSAMARVDDRG